MSGNDTLDLGHTFASGSGGAVASSPLQRLGRYLIIDQVGSGGMGVVYKAYDPELDRKVAVKVLKVDAFHAPPGGGARARLVREAQAMARLSHPNVVPIYDVGTSGDELFVAMEYVAGQTLREWLAERPRRPGEIIQQFLHAGRGIAAAHAAGLLHRDFKADNVLVDPEGNTKVTDFGLARALDATPLPLTDSTAAVKMQARLPTSSSLDQPLTQDGAVVGTPAYMAPEQFLGLGIDARTEQFNFCASLWEALYGARPFAGDTYEALSSSVTKGDVRPPADERGVPGRVRQVLVRGLARERDQRYPSFDELLSELARAARKRRGPWLVAAAALIVAAIAGSSAAWRASQPEPCPDPRAQVERAWNAQERQHLQTRFTATGAALADFSMLQLGERLDDYSRRWVNAAATACRETKLAGRSTPAEYAQQTRCLDRRLSAMRQTIESLKAIDASAVGRAQQVVLGLPGIELCLRPGADGTAASAADQAATAELVQLQEQVDRMRADMVLGMYPRILESAPAVAARAAATGEPGVQAEALYFLGQAQGASSKSEEAEATLLQAVRAAEAGGSDTVRAQALMSLAFRKATQVRYAEAHRDTDWAEAVIARIARSGKPVDDLHAELHNGRSYVHFASGDYRQSVTSAQLALKHLASAPDPYTEVKARDRLARALLFLGRPEEALREARSGERMSEVFGPLNPRTAYFHFFAAGSLNALARPDEAAQAARTALDIFTRVFGESSVHVVITLCELAKAVAVGDPDAGVEFGRRAVKLGRAGGWDVPYYETALGSVLLEVGRPAEAAEALAGGLKWAEKTIGDEHVDSAEVHADMGLAQEALGKRAEAERHFRRALAVFERKLPGHPSNIRALSGLGRVRLAAGATEEARALLERALAVSPRPMDAPHLARARLALAELAWGKGDREGALSLARQAREALAAWGRAPDALKLADAALVRFGRP